MKPKGITGYGTAAEPEAGIPETDRTKSRDILSLEGEIQNLEERMLQVQAVVQERTKKSLFYAAWVSRMWRRVLAIL